MTTHDTRSQLLAEIAANPEDDTLRLAFADWLDEHGGTHRACPACHAGAPAWANRSNCPECLGTCVVSDDADRDRAEFIRLDVERHRRWPDFTRVCEADRPKVYADWQDLAAVEKRILRIGTAHPEWSRCRCPRMADRQWGPSDPRGCSPTCPTCGGTGDLFIQPVQPGYGRSGSPLVTWSRGFPDSVPCVLSDAFAPDGTPTAWAVEVVKQTPVVRFWLTDLEPYHREASPRGPYDGRLVWDWSSAHVLDFLMKEMADAHPDKVAGDARDPVWWLEFEMEQAATDALALAAGRLVRRHAYRGKP